MTDFYREVGTNGKKRKEEKAGRRRHNVISGLVRICALGFL